MAEVQKAKVFMSGRSQAVRIPLEFRFTTDEVTIRKDPETGDVILSQAEQRKPTNWKEFFDQIDAQNIPQDFMDDRDQGNYPVREEL